MGSAVDVKNRTMTNFSELNKLARDNYWFDKRPYVMRADSD